MSESEPSVICVCGCDSRPNPREWDVRGIAMDGLRELDKPINVIGDVDVLGPSNVDMLGPTVSVPNSAAVDADNADVEIAIEDKE